MSKDIHIISRNDNFRSSLFERFTINYNICIIWWGVIASSYNKSLGVE